MTQRQEPTYRGQLPLLTSRLLSQDSGNVELDFNLSDVPEPLITAGLMIEYDPTQMSIVNADINEDGWDTGMSKQVKDPKGTTGTYMFTAGNLSLLIPMKVVTLV